ncbi:MAG: CocE/NonD family hydrolase [Rubrobacteraceae bacterium]
MSPTDILVQYDLPAEMRDGTVLRSNVYRPAAGGPFPVLLTRLPYGKDILYNNVYFDFLRAARNGYIVVMQDVRGRYASEGEFTPFVKEYEDGYDTVEWAANLPDSNGKVGMFGLSYYGNTQWHAAAGQPPALASMVPGDTWGNHLNGLQMRGGARELGLMHYWAEAALALNTLFRKYPGKPDQLRQELPAVIGSIDTLLAGGGYDVLPLTELPDPGDLVPFVRGGFARGVDDDAWEYLSLDGKYDRVQAPTFHIGGWYDCFLGETLRQYGAMKEESARRELRAPRLLIGPWTHAMFLSTVGELDFGIGSAGAFLNYRGDLTDRHLRWFDATLKDDNTALENTPPVEVFVMGENRWRGYDEWPVPGAREEHWYMRAGGGLSRQGPEQSPPDGYDYDPEAAVPTLGGAVLMPPILGSGPLDQRPIEQRPDVLTYTSDVLQESYTALGPVHATLYAASSAPDTDFVVRLVDVYPDGRAMAVTDGIIRASARESYPAPGVVGPQQPSLIEPGEVYGYAVDLWATGLTFLAGHRIRVEVTSSSFPRWERNLNTGENNATSARSRIANQRIFHDPERPSRVTLTVVDD